MYVCTVCVCIYVLYIYMYIYVLCTYIYILYTLCIYIIYYMYVPVCVYIYKYIYICTVYIYILYTLCVYIIAIQKPSNLLKTQSNPPRCWGGHQSEGLRPGEEFRRRSLRGRQQGSTARRRWEGSKSSRNVRTMSGKYREMW
jgi:hypothetical protein